MSEDIRVRLFLEQVEQVEKLLTSKQQVGTHLELDLDSIKPDLRIQLIHPQVLPFAVTMVQQ